MPESESSAASSREESEAASTDASLSEVSVKEESDNTFYYNGRVNPHSLKRLLKACLDNVKTAGSFATSGVLAETTIPGLSVRNVGSIGFPLQEEQAKAIIGACHRAPFGQGKPTAISPNRRVSQFL